MTWRRDVSEIESRTRPHLLSRMIELGGGVKSPRELREPSLRSPMELQELTRWRRRRAMPVSGKEEGGARRRGEEEVGGEEHRYTPASTWCLKPAYTKLWAWAKLWATTRGPSAGSLHSR